MNLALHGILLQVFVSILNSHYGRVLCSAGEPGYLDFDNLPETNFSCQGKVIGGYYADVEAGCQMFHVCTIGQKDEIMDIKFLCLNGTVFDQETRVCERVDEVDCSKSERFYNLNLELYGNNAVTLSLHENEENEDNLAEPVEDHQPRTTSVRPSTTSTTSSTTTSRPSKPSTTAASGSFQHPAGYPQHYQPQPSFPQVRTSQSKSLYDDKNGGYHHQYIFHNGERANDQATSYQLFSNQGAAVSSTTMLPPPTPQIHQVRYSSTVGPPPQIIHKEPSTVTPLFHATSSTIQTLLNSNTNSPVALINPIFHNQGIVSTTERFTVHSNNPRETSDYHDESEDVLPLEMVHSINKEKESSRAVQKITTRSQTSQQQSQQKQQRITDNFLPTLSTVETTIRSFYPTPKPSPKTSQSSQSVTHRVMQHVHVSQQGVSVPQLKPHQITINLSPPDIQRIVQNPSPLLPSQSRVIVTAKASVSDESGRPLNTTQLVTLPLPTIPASYDDYKEGDESFDPFYRDVPKIRKSRRITSRSLTKRRKRSLDKLYRFVYGMDNRNGNTKVIQNKEQDNGKNNVMGEKNGFENASGDFRAIKESLIKFKDIFFSDEVDEVDSLRNIEEIKNDTKHIKIADSKLVGQTKKKPIAKLDHLLDLKMEASKHLDLHNEDDRDDKKEHDLFSSTETNTEKPSDKEESIKNTKSEHELETAVNTESTHFEKKSHRQDDVIDVIILDSTNTFEAKPTMNLDVKTPKTSALIEILEDETRSGSRNLSRVSKKFIYNETEITGYYRTKSKSENQLTSTSNKEKQMRPQETKQTNVKDSMEQKSGTSKNVSRLRSPRRRISSKMKQENTENAKVTETTQQKDKEEKTTAATSIAAASTTATFVITTPSSPSYEAKVAEQINSYIFKKSESPTSKEIDTRAVSQHNAMYSKNLRDDKSHDFQKNKEIEQSFDDQTTKDYAKNSEQHTNMSEEEEEIEQETESPDYAQSTSLEDISFTENPQKIEKEIESIENTRVSEERTFLDEDLLFKRTLNKTSADECIIEDTNDRKLEESSEQIPNKTFHKTALFSREDNFHREKSDREDKSVTSSVDNANEKEPLIMKYSEETISAELNESEDTTEFSVENTSDTNIQEKYKDSENIDDSTMSADHTTSEKYIHSQEDVNSTEETGVSTGDILKFTDELPKLDSKDEDVETKEKFGEYDEIDTYDYVDDNYESQNYKKIEKITTESYDFKEESAEKKNEKKKNIVKEVDNKKNIEIHETDNDSVEEETQTKYTESTTEVINLKQIAEETNISFSTISTLTSATTSMTTTTTATTTTTTPRPPTTTPRATPPKLVKPTGSRRIYAYIPLTTTPNPVVIKPRTGLFNPKPAKPPKSYNELAPKPMIRKLSLSRKPVTTTTSTTSTTMTITDTIITERLNTELPETTMESVLTTTTTTTETGRSEENILENKLEKNELVLLNLKNDQTEKEDQLPSPTEQKIPVNSSRDTKPQTSTEEIGTFTPYPLSRLSILTPSVQQTTQKIEQQETTDIFMTTLPSTLLPEKLYIETSTDKYIEQAKLVLASTEVQQDVTEIPSITFDYPPTSVLISTTVQPKMKDANSVIETSETPETIEFSKPSNRKLSSNPQHASFNCLKKEMYHFYGDTRDCRLFHYCSPGFTSRQVLDFRFVCEKGTVFDEETQSCRHDVRNRMCRNRPW